MSDEAVISLGLLLGIAYATGKALDAGIHGCLTWYRSRTEPLHRRVVDVENGTIVYLFYANRHGTARAFNEAGETYLPPRDFLWTYDKRGNPIEWSPEE
jgi:hypothetical protein